MRAQNTNATPTESMPTSVAVESKPQPPANKKIKIFKVLTIHSEWGEQPSLRLFKIAANGIRDARNLARTMVYRLDYELETISSDAQEVGEGMEGVEIFDVYEARYDIPGHVWTREQIDSDDLDILVERVASESEEATEDPVVELSR